MLDATTTERPAADVREIVEEIAAAPTPEAEAVVFRRLIDADAGPQDGMSFNELLNGTRTAVGRVPDANRLTSFADNGDPDMDADAAALANRWLEALAAFPTADVERVRQKVALVNEWRQPSRPVERPFGLAEEIGDDDENYLYHHRLIRDGQVAALRGPWDDAHLAYREADAYADDWLACCKKTEAQGEDATDLNRCFEVAMDVAADRERVLVDLPTPDVVAAAIKLRSGLELEVRRNEALHDPETFERLLTDAGGNWSALVALRVYQDLLRLAGDPSPVVHAQPFDATGWLAAFEQLPGHRLCRGGPVYAEEALAGLAAGEPPAGRQLWRDLPEWKRELVRGVAAERADEEIAAEQIRLEAQRPTVPRPGRTVEQVREELDDLGVACDGRGFSAVAGFCDEAWNILQSLTRDEINALVSRQVAA